MGAAILMSRSSRSGPLWAEGGSLPQGVRLHPRKFPTPAFYAASFIAPLMIIEALFAAAYNVL